MDGEPPFLSAEDLDAMTPDERLAAFRARVITDLDEVPVAFREHILETARRLGEERRSRR